MKYDRERTKMRQKNWLRKGVTDRDRQREIKKVTDKGRHKGEKRRQNRYKKGRERERERKKLIKR
jgi:hypothetical protein